MKYNSTNKPLVCMQTNSKCYKNAGNMTIKGVLWHSTGANNPMIRRYVQPSDNDPKRNELLKLLGKNQYNNDWNHIIVDAGLNAWIGKLDNDKVSTVQTMPWNHRPWGCGPGSRGSCNDGWIQFEICEDNLNSRSYFEAVYKEACELTAYLCKEYNLNPYGTVPFNGVNVPVITCHCESHDLGFGTNHGDVLHWFSKYGKDMNDIRNDVAKLMNSIIPDPKPTPTPKPETSSTLKVGEKIKFINSSAKYSNGASIPNWVFNSTLYLRQIDSNGETCVISTLQSGAVTGRVYLKDIAPVNAVKPNFSPYLVKITTAVLNVRSGPSTNYSRTTQVKANEVYTIVDENNGWGKLKSGAGWICLDYTKRV